MDDLNQSLCRWNISSDMNEPSNSHATFSPTQNPYQPDFKYPDFNDSNYFSKGQSLYYNVNFPDKNGKNKKDSKWLQVEICRDFMRSDCKRNQEECRYAHPHRTLQIDNGRVTACYDYLKKKCYRNRCKFFHPPQHIVNQILYNGKAYQQQNLSNFDYPSNTDGLTNNRNFPIGSEFSYWFPWGMDVYGSSYLFPFQNIEYPFDYYAYMNYPTPSPDEGIVDFSIDSPYIPQNTATRDYYDSFDSLPILTPEP